MIYARNGQDKLSNFGSTATALKCKVYLCLTVQELGRREAGSLEFSMLIYTCMFFSDSLSSRAHESTTN